MGRPTKWAWTGSNRVALVAASAALLVSAAGWISADLPRAGTGTAALANASMSRPVRILPAATVDIATPRLAPHADMLAGPVSARVERVVDGDTLLVRAHIWVDQQVQVAVRIRGIDAPELRAGCAAERTLARRAADFVRLAVSGKTVQLSVVSGGKYFGRVLADVTTENGRALGPELIAAGLARPYGGGTRTAWCRRTADDRLDPNRKGS
jgi:endonuclease YncB( thermonuclease family)